LQAALGDIRAGKAAEMLSARWAESEGQRCAGVNWERTTLSELLEIAECVGGRGLAAVCAMKVTRAANMLCVNEMKAMH
jgi:Fanconi-associated nuclease 1